MSGQETVRGYRFGTFEADVETGELRRQGVRVKLNSQPFQMLLVLLERPGQLVTREEIARRMWPEGTFVDYEHGVNSAVNRIREVLGDTAANPRFVETLARRGYRFVAPVEALRSAVAMETAASMRPLNADENAAAGRKATQARAQGFLASAEELPKVPHAVVTVLFVLLQVMYLAFYAGALMNLGEIEELLSALPRAGEIYITLLVTAAVLIPVRAFTLCAVLFRAPGVTKKLLRLWPFLLVLDEVWALAPFLLLHHINFGFALACMALLVYSPFAQRALALMGAGVAPGEEAVAGHAG